MKPDALLIDTALGGLVDEFSLEPPQDLEILSLPTFLATPHIGGSAEEAILAIGRAAIDGLDHNTLLVPD